MTKETITIRKRWLFQTALTVEIDCDETLTPRVKLGLAVKAAHDTRQNLRGAVLTGAVLTGAVLRGAVLTGAVLTGAVLRGAVLTGADLTGAVLRGAVLTGADLTGAVLTGADLRGAVLTGAVLTGADLTGAVLTGAVLTGSRIKSMFACANRLDGYTFYGLALMEGGYKIAAGCRWFTDAEFRDHVAVEYPDTDKAAETLAILDFIAARAAVTDLGAVEAIERGAK